MSNEHQANQIPSITQEFTVTIKVKETFIRKMSEKEIGQWVKASMNKWSNVKVIKVEET